jgi:hypothetical protein
VRAAKKGNGKGLLLLSIRSAVFGCCLLCGCSVWEYFKHDKPPYDAELYATYDQTILKVSSSGAVLSVIHRPEHELLSQSKSVVASVGQKRKGRKIWFNMVAFDETSLTAKRKYIFIVDDRPNPMEEPRKSLSLDCEMVLDTKILQEPYANENARRIAILRQVLERSRKDADEVGPDNQTLDVCGKLLGQTLEAALVELEASAALASRLSEPAGVEFSHINLGRGRIQLLLTDDMVKIKMRLGRLVKKWEKSLEENAEQGEPVAESVYY